MEEWMQESPKQVKEADARMSYRDSVRNPQRSLNFEKEENDTTIEPGPKGSGEDISDSSSSDEDIEDKDGDNGIAVEKDVFDRINFTLSEREWKRLNKPFKKTLIIKLLGKTVGFKFLLRKVNQLWGRTGEIELVDLGNNYFLEKFDTYSDLDFALTGGPWIILDHYLIIRSWTSLFDPEEVIQKVAAWVHLPDLPIELYDTKFLYTLGNLIGKVLRVDANTTHQIRGKFARLCVELDLSKPLLSQYYVHGRVRNIEYEGLHLICFECGVYSHDLEHCPVRRARLEKEKQDKEKGITSEDPNNEGKRAGKEYSQYGAWMIVDKPRRPRRARTITQNLLNDIREDDQPHGSRFAALEILDQDNTENQTDQAVDDNNQEMQQKTWTKSKKNPMFEKEEAHITTTKVNQPEMMELGTPAKTTSQQKDQRSEIKEPELNSDSMVVSPYKPPVKSDFNEIASITEQKGGSPPNIQRCNQFQSWIDRCNLIDSKPAGPFFTWEGPRRPNQDKLFKRLDRVLLSPSWRTQFQDASVKNIVKIHSDHHPMLVNTEEECTNSAERPFRFEACWMKHEGFIQLVKDKWDNAADLTSMLNQFSISLKDWNKNVFGHILKRKKNLLSRLKGIQRAKERKFNHFLAKLEKELKQELEDILNQEETLWYQKVRCAWIKDGDRNTKYYHTKAINRRRRNKILMLKKENGEWEENLEEVKGIVVKFFKDLFNEENVVGQQQETEIRWPIMEARDWESINIPFSEEEIIRAVNSIGGMKAPGNDGFPASFYQRNWEFVSGSFRRTQEIGKYLGANIIHGRHVNLNLWVQLMLKKYKVSSNPHIDLHSKVTDSRLWKELCHIWPDFYKNVYWSLGNGTRTWFWKDIWIHDKISLMQLCEEKTGGQNPNTLTKDFIDSSGQWDRARLHSCIPIDILNKVLDISPPNHLLGPDQAMWKFDKEGGFSISSAYMAIKDFDQRKLNNIWTTLWKSKMQQRNKLLIWRLCHEKLPTRSRIASWSSSSPLCLWCDCCRETNIHAIRDYSRVAHIWKAFLNPKVRAIFFSLPIKEWVKWNLHNNVNFCNIPWSILFSTACGLFWYWRNLN
ncbi:reverse transcriptase [Senna tora]|uniref:Reverse transcriptase n=1 Tax=Senna tora TaxID=362788 RepID=A0A834TT02_9FABA|nr:reverse transcriptase [Senna tora]